MSTAHSEQQQRDIGALLRNDPDLESIAVVELHKGDTISMLSKALAGTFQSGKLPGSSITVMQPTEEPAKKEAMIIRVKRTHSVLVEEIVMQNRLQDGSGDTRCGDTADSLKDKVIVALHGMHLGRAALDWVKAEPVNDGKGRIGWDVQFVILDSLPMPARAACVIAISGTTVTITGTGAPGEAIYWTDDESTPVEDNSAATLYTEPFTSSSGKVIRAAAVATGLRSSYMQIAQVP